MHSHQPQIIGTIAGAVLPALTINTADIKATIILSIIGAVTGYLTTLMLKQIMKKINEYKNKK